MGSALGCIKKPAETDQELVLEKATKDPAAIPAGETAENADPKDDLEKVFDSLYDKIVIPNENVAKKLKELPKFDFEKRAELALLEIREGDTTVPGETYYGFWYPFCVCVLLVLFTKNLNNCDLYRDLISKCREYKGIIVFEDGSLLEGHFSKDLLVGRCRKIYPNLDIYEGSIENYQYNGMGKYLKSDGGSYVGNWKNGVPDSEGCETLPNGLVYTGTFKNGQKTGKGKLTFPDGNEYIGELLDGKPEGKGTYTKKSGERYEGDWKNGLKHGKGVIWYPDGERYEGDFAYGIKNGFGKQFWTNGRTAEGTWVNGVQHGLFKLIIPKQGIYTCQFENGAPVKDAEIKPYLAPASPQRKEGTASIVMGAGLSTICH